jgi:hypothetical protein
VSRPKRGSGVTVVVLDMPFADVSVVVPSAPVNAVFVKLSGPVTACEIEPSGPKVIA